METDQIQTCYNCSKVLPGIGFFCGGCLVQFKCKSCGSLLEKDSIGCVICGAPKEERIVPTSVNSTQNANSFRLHETLTDRTIEATFSDAVGKDLAGIIKDAYTVKLGNQARIITSKEPIGSINQRDEPEEIQEAQISSDDDLPEEKKIPIPTKQSSLQQPEYPTLKAIAMRNLPGSETEWIVVYSFYSSDFGKQIFSRQDIIKRYEESNRKNKDRIKQLSVYINRAVQAEYINPLENGFSVLELGIEKAKEIITRSSSAAPKLAKKTSSLAKGKESANENGIGRKSSKNMQVFKRLPNINFYPSGQDSLANFYKKFTVKNDNENNLLFTFYLSETLKIADVSLNHIYTCYDELGLRIPEKMIQSLGNTKTRTGWLESKGSSNIVVTVKGRNKIKFWNKKK